MLEHGKIVHVDEIRQGTSTRTGEIWKSQDFTVEIDGRWVRHATFNLYGAAQVERANLQVGMIVDVEFEIDSREFKGHWYNELRAYNIMIGGRSIVRE